MKYLVLLFLIVIFSCIRDVDVSIENREKNIVLNCILNTANDTVFVKLSYSKQVLSSNFFAPLNNVDIKLFENNVLLGKFLKKDSITYFLPYIVKGGSGYKIEATSAENTIWAITKIPTKVNVNIISINNNHNSFDYKVSFADNKKEDNYYWLSAKGFSTYNEKNYLGIAGALYSNYSFSDDFNRIVEQEYEYIYEYEYYIRINDKYLPQDSVCCRFYPSGIHISNGPQTIYVLSTDYNLDKYMKSSLLMANIDYYAEEVPIAYSPFPVYSNIHGGTGIFGSFTSVSKTFTQE